MGQEVKISHILVKGSGKAQTLIDEIKAGKDFGKLAKAHSDCPSGKKGGSLGKVKRGQMVKEFERASFQLKVGEMTDTPVKTKFGFHIIKRTG